MTTFVFRQFPYQIVSHGLNQRNCFMWWVTLDLIRINDMSDYRCVKDFWSFASCQSLRNLAPSAWWSPSLDDKFPHVWTFSNKLSYLMKMKLALSSSSLPRFKALGLSWNSYGYFQFISIISCNLFLSIMYICLLL